MGSPRTLCQCLVQAHSGVALCLHCAPGLEDGTRANALGTEVVPEPSQVKTGFPHML